MQDIDLNYNRMQLCNAADHTTTKRLQFVQVGAQTEDASGKCPGQAY